MPLVVWPFSGWYFEIVIFGSFYVPHIAISFVSIGLYNKLIHSDKNRKFFVLAGIYGLLAVLAGMGGFRQLLELYVPFFLAIFYLEFSKHLLTVKIINRNTILAALGMMAALFGLVINNALHNVYQFKNMSEMTLTQLSAENIFTVLNGILYAFGYRPGYKLFSLNGILSMGVLLAILIVGYLIYAAIKSERREEKIYGYYILFTLLLHFVVFLFTDTERFGRYWIPLIAMTLPLIGFGVSEKESVKCKFAKVGAFAAMICIFVNGMNVLKERTDVPEQTMRNEVAEFLVDNGYSYGYADFWSANVFTELTDGAIRISSISDWTQLGSYTWLTRAEDVGRMYEDKVFIIVEKSDGIDRSGCRYINDGFVVFENEKYLVYSYMNTQDLLQYVN